MHINHLRHEKSSRWIADTVRIGAWASVLSTVVLSILSVRATGAASSGTNATSKWIWGNAACRVERPTARHTAVGYVIHHLSSLLWAGLFAWPAKTPRSRLAVVGRAATVTALAAAVDYLAVPRRLTPGFEAHLPARKIAWVYAGFAAGLYIGARLHQPSRTARIARTTIVRRV